MSGNSHTDKNGDVADVSVSPVEIIAVDEMEETKLAATRQKLIKAGLLAVLAVIVIYVVLDYTVSIYICWHHMLIPKTVCVLLLRLLLLLLLHSLVCRRLVLLAGGARVCEIGTSACNSVPWYLVTSVLQYRDRELQSSTTTKPRVSRPSIQREASYDTSTSGIPCHVFAHQEPHSSCTPFSRVYELDL